MDLSKKVSILVIVACLLLALKNEQAAHDLHTSSLEHPLPRRNLGDDHRGRLAYDYYSDSCPVAESLIRSTTRELYASNISIAPALLRLVFHDCFIMVIFLICFYTSYIINQRLLC